MTAGVQQVFEQGSSARIDAPDASKTDAEDIPFVDQVLTLFESTVWHPMRAVRNSSVASITSTGMGSSASSSVVKWSHGRAAVWLDPFTESELFQDAWELIVKRVTRRF